MILYAVNQYKPALNFHIIIKIQKKLIWNTPQRVVKLDEYIWICFIRFVTEDYHFQENIIGPFGKC
jgi:hypothetical protein